RTLQVNYGDVFVKGADALVEIGRGRAISGGGSYQFADADDPPGGAMGVALENFPRHKADAWLEARYHSRTGAWTRLRYVGGRTWGCRAEPTARSMHRSGRAWDTICAQRPASRT